MENNNSNIYHEMMMTTNSNGEGGGGSTTGTSNGGGEGGVQLKKGPWTAAEDAILTAYVKRNGEGNWNAVQRNSGLARCGKSCRLRWANHLRPNLKKGSFSPDEEMLIVQLHAKFGNKWARMAAQLPGRTDNEIKNYWNTRIKRRHRQGLPLYPPDIRPEHPQAKHQQIQSHKTTQHQHQHQHLHQPPLPLSPHQHSQPTTPYSSTPATPTTPNSTFSFQTQFPSPTQTQAPPSLSPTPPSMSPLPSPNSSSFPVLPLFDPFSIPRTPPLFMTNSIRFKRHHLGTTTNNHTTSTPFSVPVSEFSLYTHQANRSLNCLPAFQQISPIPMMPDQSVYPVKLELPSSQFGSQNGDSDIMFDTQVNGNSGLLEDLLEEAHQALTDGDSSKRDSCFGLQEESTRAFNGFGRRWDDSATSMSLSSALEPKTADHQQINTMHEDLSKNFHGISSSIMQAQEWYSDNGELSNGQSSVVTDDNMGLQMHHIASFFPVNGTSTDPRRTPSSCSWDNLTGIC